jgi:hypothetical protein
MKTLDLAARLANGDGALPVLLQTSPFFIEKRVGKHRQTPEAHERGGTHALILIQAELFLAISKEDFDVEAELRYTPPNPAPKRRDRWKPNNVPARWEPPTIDAR